MTEYEDMQKRERNLWIKIISAVVMISFSFIGGCMAWYPQYKIYEQRLDGEAELAKQTYSKQVAVQAAIAKKESAVLLAEAEVMRAEGVAKANKIIGDSLKDNEQYLRYLWITNLENSKGDIIYIPTEAGIPILEAGKRKESK
jgi:regulator of protease activity HflC (stomatin/prohibitin superfamily)